MCQMTYIKRMGKRNDLHWTRAMSLVFFTHESIVMPSYRLSYNLGVGSPASSVIFTTALPETWRFDKSFSA